MAWEILHLTDPPMHRDDVPPIQHEALDRFGSYAIPLGVRENGVYDQATSDFVAAFQTRKNASGYQPRLRTDGWCDYATKAALGVLPAPPVPKPPTYLGLCVPGTWGVWNIGPQVMAVNRQPDKVQVQGVGFNTGAFLNPDPRHSYVDARNEGTAELLRLALPDPRPKFITGYSLGADIVVRFLEQWPTARRGEITGVFTFGSPGRPPGVTKLGFDHGGAGISGVYTPEWARDREWSYTISGDMYPCSVGLLPQIYEILTRMEATAAFMRYLFGMLSSKFGPVLLGLTKTAAGILIPAAIGVAGAAIPGFGALAPILGLVTKGLITDITGPLSLAAMMLNLPMIISTLMAALKFVFTNAHQKYWVNPIFEGMTAENHAASIVRQLAT
jgi:hypothetical protein